MVISAPSSTHPGLTLEIADRLRSVLSMKAHLRALLLVAALVANSGGVVLAQTRAGDPRLELGAALAAMGGRKVLASVHILRLEAVGHRNMLEQSLRPAGPWWQDYFQLDELRDFDSGSERVAQQHRGYSSLQW